MMLHQSAVWFVAVLLSAASASIKDTLSKYPCTDPLSSKMLSEAVDAALMSLHAQSGWLYNLRKRNNYRHPIEVAMCTPKTSMWPWPGAEMADGLLAHVLDSGKLRVAGVKWKKGGAADYISNPSAPTGFWPEYMSAIANVMSSQYGKTITVQRVYYDNSDLVNEAVANGTDVDMSEPYYYLGGFYNSMPRIEVLQFSCVTVATHSVFSSTRASGIKSTDDLYEKILEGPNRKVGFIGAGNYDAVSHVLPANVEPIYITDDSELEAQVDDGTLLASYISEGHASHEDRFVYETGVISPRVVLFRRDSTKQCVHSEALQAVSSQTVSSGDDTTTTEDECEDNTLLLIVMIILAAVVFLLTCLVILLICKERGGKPLFMAPLKEQNGSGQIYGQSM